MPAVVLPLRMIERIAIDLGCAGKEKARAILDRPVEQPPGTLGIDQQRFDRELLIFGRTRRAGAVIDPVELRQLRQYLYSDRNRPAKTPGLPSNAARLLAPSR